MANEDANGDENSSDEENKSPSLATISTDRNCRSPSTDVEELSGMVSIYILICNIYLLSINRCCSLKLLL